MSSKAFTLVELLIVVGIIGLLASIGVAAYSSTKVNARNLQRKSNLAQVQKALELYANDNGGLYPITGVSQYWGETSVYGSHPLSGSNGYIPNLAPGYIGLLPHDPNTNTTNSGSANATCRGTTTRNAYWYHSDDGREYKFACDCLPEGTLSASDPFYDPTRPTWSWAVFSPGGSGE